MSTEAKDRETLNLILEALAELPDTHLKTLQDHIGLLRKKTRSERLLDEEQTLFYDILTSRIRRFVIRGVGLREGKSPLPKARGFNRKLFIVGHEALVEFWKPMKLNRADTVRMYSLYADSLILYVKQLYPDQVGLKKIVECCGRVGEVLDTQFPGYFTGGLTAPAARAIADLWLKRDD